MPVSRKRKIKSKKNQKPPAAKLIAKRHNHDIIISNHSIQKVISAIDNNILYGKI